MLKNNTNVEGPINCKAATSTTTYGSYISAKQVDD